MTIPSAGHGPGDQIPPLPPYVPEAGWPTNADVARSLGITTTTPPDSLRVAVDAAAEMVQNDVGYYTLTPPKPLWLAAWLAAVVALKAPDAPHGVASVFDVGALYVTREHPTYVKLLTGWRRQFGIGG